MIDKYVLATNDDGDLAIRTVSATESSSVTDTTSVITATDDGKLAVRVVGTGGGGDSHNKGSFLTPEALRTAYPTAEPGDFAIVESTDTVWVWDSDGSDWKDGDTKGQVTSVNNQTGAVTLGINDVAPTQTGKSGYVLGTDGFVAGWVEPEIVQRSTMPVASQDEEGNIYQFIGTTDANYTHGYFYECVSDGGNPATYSWTQTDVQPSSGGLPSQTGNSGKFLTTDGTDASWSNKLVVTDNNIRIGTGTSVGSNDISVVIGGYSNSSKTATLVAGPSASCGAVGGVALGAYSTATAWGTDQSTDAIAIGHYSQAKATHAIQLGATGSYTTNLDANTFKVANANGNYEIMSADGTIPTDRYTTTPSADGTYVPTLTISSGVATRTWGAAASAPVVPATMPTLAVADWSSNTQTVNVTGVTASNIVFVSPAPASAADYAAAGIVCTAQGSGTLTFTCTTVPSNAITVNVVILG